MKYIVILAVIILSGCATWDQTARSAASQAHAGGVVLLEDTLPIINNLCDDAVDKCLARGDRADCPELRKCDEARKTFGEALKTLQRAVKITFIAIDQLESLGLTPKKVGE